MKILEMRAIALSLLLSALLAPPIFGDAFAQAEEKKRVIWRITDWPPFYILGGPLKGQGLYDLMIAEYKKKLPDFEHRHMQLTTMRALQQMKTRQEGMAVCHVSMLLSSLTGFAHASELGSVLLPHAIIATREAAPKILALSERGDGFVSVEKLFHSPDIRGAHTSFGTHAALEKYQYVDNPFPNVTMTAENYAGLARLFLNGRVEYVIQYEPFVQTLVESGADRNDIVVIPISETRENPYIKVYAGCTRNSIGGEVINKINQVLAEKPDVLQQARLQWYGAATRARLKKIYEDVAPELNDY